MLQLNTLSIINFISISAVDFISEYPSSVRDFSFVIITSFGGISFAGETAGGREDGGGAVS